MKKTVSQLELKIAVLPEDRNKAIELLQMHNIPTVDLDDDKLLYLLWEGDSVIGTGGLEIYSDCGLLRSISVLPKKKNKGHGGFILSQLEKFAFDGGIRCLYLMTTTARDFFDKKGYCAIRREDVSPEIKQSSEFTSVCPSTAVVMKKTLG